MIRLASYNVHKCVGMDRRRQPERIVAVLNALDAATRAELLGLFPALGTEAGRQGFAAVRPVLSGAEAKVLFAA